MGIAVFRFAPIGDMSFVAVNGCSGAGTRLTTFSVHIENADVQVSQAKVSSLPEADTRVLTLANPPPIKTTASPYINLPEA
ncbi:hypothetical protein G6L68_22555 [Agrobacterium fabrum]|jgi:hypothetical protein|uniref:hypothetical protein n=1 Tax=Agrobacterium fabrum TaxID=1176649 RepID=UPI000EF5D809|nr:hypothetical protein [Agrobacterium fabrum]AYM65627.1 hypothetical protein At12D13_44750 [Agrobacterium fabrum]NTE63438.1 hypothetical protein [Agrobacterium fabrum]